jgi:hypothetical protein
VAATPANTRIRVMNVEISVETKMEDRVSNKPMIEKHFPANF